MRSIDYCSSTILVSYAAKPDCERETRGYRPGVSRAYRTPPGWSIPSASPWSPLALLNRGIGNADARRTFCCPAHRPIEGLGLCQRSPKQREKNDKGRESWQRCDILPNRVKNSCFRDKQLLEEYCDRPVTVTAATHFISKLIRLSKFPATRVNYVLNVLRGRRRPVDSDSCPT